MSWFETNRPQVQPTRATTTGLVPPAAPTLQAPNGDAGYYTDWGGGNKAQQQRQILDAQNAGAPLGFDKDKWKDPTKGTSQKYTGSRIIGAGGSVDDVLAQPDRKGWTKVSNDKVKSPEGNVYDMIFDEDNASGQRRAQYTLVGGPRWDAEQNNGYQGNIGGATGRGTPQGDAKYAAYLASGGAPIPGPQPGGGTLANPGGGSTADFKVNPWDKKFVAPTQGEAANDQGFQFTLARGKEALERSAAARGTLLTTGTLKDLDSFSQDRGSQQYDKVYGRRMGEYETDYRNFTGNESARFGAHQANFGNNLNLNQNQFNQGLATNQNAFNQQYSLASLGMNAATGSNQSSQNNSNTAGGLYTQQGNVNASGQIGSQNAWNGAIGNLSNIGQYYAQLYGNRQQNPTREQAWTY